MERKINTVLVLPPIPTDKFNWCAYYDPEGIYGWGENEELAIQDLKGNCDE